MGGGLDRADRRQPLHAAGHTRAGRILREAYADASIRLPVIRDLGLSLLPPAAKPMPRAVAPPDAVNEPVPV